MEHPKDTAGTDAPSSDPARARERATITEEIDLKVNAVGIEVLARMQTLQLRQTEAEELLQSYDLPVLLSTVSSLRQDLSDASEELQSIKEELQGQLEGQLEGAEDGHELS